MSLILIVDDNRDIVEVLQLALSKYRTIFASDGVAALHQLAEESPDLVLVNLCMAGMDGAVLIAKIRALGDTPIIVLSGRHEQADIVQALNAGADDFVWKPFDIDDLEARVVAVLRRAKREPIPPEPEPELRVGLLTMSYARGPRIAGEVVQLTPTMARLLTLFMEHPDELLTHKFIADSMWGDGLGVEHLIHIHVNRLRARLGHQKGAPTIETRHGHGYLLQPAKGIPV